MGTYRNGQRVYDINVYSLNVSRNPNSGSLQLKMQLLDRNLDTVETAGYIVDATFSFNKIE